MAEKKSDAEVYREIVNGPAKRLVSEYLAEWRENPLPASPTRLSEQLENENG